MIHSFKIQKNITNMKHYILSFVVELFEIREKGNRYYEINVGISFEQHIFINKIIYMHIILFM